MSAPNQIASTNESPTEREITLPIPAETSTRPDSERLSVRSFGKTDCGLVRPSNQDQFLIATLPKTLRVEQSSLSPAEVQPAADSGHIFVVADGIGGSSGGEEASALAVRSIEDFLLNSLKWFLDLQGPEGDALIGEFREALRLADAKIFDEAARHPELEGMGTTLTMAYSLKSELFVAHVGDSRCYLFRGGVLHQLTRDHTLAQDMVAQGLIRPEQADSHPLRRAMNTITNAVGGHRPGVDVELHKVPLQPDDALLLCTDGLSHMVSDEQIVATLGAQPDPQTACERLVAQALEHGGRDNVTVIVARYEPSRHNAESLHA